MSVWLLPDLRPFYGGTYFPPTDTQGRPGFVTILRAIEDAYKNRREQVTRSAEQLVDILGQLAEPTKPSRAMTIDDGFINELLDRSTSDFDPANGGFGTAPKFPRETLLELLLVASQSKIKNQKSRIESSLDSMANGGIRDHLGGGFHRYSTDAQWLVPHFEIMLYDNAMLGWIYVEASRQFGNDRYARVARGIFDFVLREMTSPEGAFYTALDAEVDAMEGGSYLWTEQQVRDVLGQAFAHAEVERFLQVYGLDQGPNFADPHHSSGVPDQNILYLPHGPGVDEGDPLMARMRQALYDARRQRKQPLLDTKVITSWNALMIRALAHGGAVLGEQRYLAAASRAAHFLLREHRQPDGTLYRTSREGSKKYDGFLDDYAFLAQALLELSHATGDESWRREAAAVAQTMQQKFGDPSGGYYFTDASAADLVVRQKVATDSPLPSGNAVAAMVMLELGDAAAARKTLTTFAATLHQQAEAMSAMIQAAMQYVAGHGPLPVKPGAATGERPLTPSELATRVVGIGSGWRDPRTLEVKLQILKPFHINGHVAGEGLVATELRVADHPGVSIDYPPGERYEGQATLTVTFAAPPTTPLRLRLRYQACDESACLTESAKEFEVAPADR
jgi:uncharacterized protein YyaL (SSP411 family)